MDDFDSILQSSSLSEDEIVIARHYRSTLGEKGRNSFQAAFHDAIRGLQSNDKLIAQHLDTFDFLCSIPFDKNDVNQSMILRCSCLVQIHEATLQWRKLLTSSLPILYNGRLALVEILRHCGDIDELFSKLTSSVSSPRKSTATAIARRSKFSSSGAKEMLPTSGYFPFSAPLDERSTSESHLETLSLLMPRVQQALRYFRCEHDRQMCLAERRVHLASQGKWQSVLIVLHRHVGFQNAMDPETELTNATATLRTVSRLYSDDDKALLKLHYESMIAPKIDMQNSIGSHRRLPEYVTIVERCDPSTQLEIATAFAVLSRAFGSWLSWTYRRGMAIDAEQLCSIVEIHHMKQRMSDWHRWIMISRDAKTASIAVPRIRRKVLSGGADKEPTPLADAHFADKQGYEIAAAQPVIHDSDVQTVPTKKRGLFIKFHR